MFDYTCRECGASFPATLLEHHYRKRHPAQWLAISTQSWRHGQDALQREMWELDQMSEQILAGERPCIT